MFECYGIKIYGYIYNNDQIIGIYMAIYMWLLNDGKSDEMKKIRKENRWQLSDEINNMGHMYVYVYMMKILPSCLNCTVKYIIGNDKRKRNNRETKWFLGSWSNEPYGFEKWMSWKPTGANTWIIDESARYGSEIWILYLYMHICFVRNY